MNTQLSLQFDGTTVDPLKYVLSDDDGNQVVPDNATLTVNNHGTELTIGGTPTVSEGEITYKWLAAEESSLRTSLPSLDIRARWTFVKGADTFERTQYFDVVAVNIRSMVTDRQLATHWTRIEKRRDRFIGRATNGSDTEIIDTDKLSKFPSNVFEGSTVKMKTGSNKGQERVVVLYDPTTSTLTVDPAFDDTVGSPDTYEINVSYNPQIRAAWKVIQNRARSWLKDQRFARLLDGVDFSDAHQWLALQMIGDILSEDDGDVFEDKAQIYGGYYEAAMKSARIKYDADVDQNADGLVAEDIATTTAILRVWAK